MAVRYTHVCDFCKTEHASASHRAPDRWFRVVMIADASGCEWAALVCWNCAEPLFGKMPKPTEA